MHNATRNKLDEKSRRGIVLNFLPCGIYRVWDIYQKKIFDLRHVVINETMFPAKMTESSPFQDDGNVNLDGFCECFDEIENKETPKYIRSRNCRG